MTPTAILFVDDDLQLRDLVVAFLWVRPYGADGERRLRGRSGYSSGAVYLLLTDVKMPG
jgi:hypothetical protein